MRSCELTAMSEAEDAFSSRVASVFGSLGGAQTGTGAGWALKLGGAARSGGAAEQENSEDEEAAPEALSGADSDEEQAAYACKASLSYRMAFEREDEDDEYDQLAAGGLHGRRLPGDCMPAGSTEVLEDNAYDRMCSMRSTAHALEQVTVQQDEDMQDAPALDVQPPPSTSTTSAAAAAAAAGPGSLLQQMPQATAGAVARSSSIPTASTLLQGTAPAAAVAGLAAHPPSGSDGLPELPILPPGMDVGNMDAAARAAEKAAYVHGLEQRLQELQDYENKHRPPQQQGNGAARHTHEQVQQAGAAEQHQQQQQQQQQQQGSAGQGPAKRTKRVSFADEVADTKGHVHQACSVDGGGDLQQQVMAMTFSRGRAANGPSSSQRAGNGLGPSTSGRRTALAAGGVGRGRGGGRRGGRGVPDHVVNPHKYKVYTLDEPLFVGGGDRDDEEEEGWKAAEDARIAAAALKATQAAGAGSAAGGGSSSDYMSAEQLAAQQQQQQQMGGAGGGASEAAGFKFRPSGKKSGHPKAAADSAPAAATAAAAMSSRGAAKGAFLEEDEPEDQEGGAAAGVAGALGQAAAPMEVEGAEGVAAAQGPSSTKRRQFRSKNSLD